jgi:MoxR-like ATPase
MQEHHITVAGQRHDLPRPFHVLATQNPIEQEGTYPLPEAQLDRFLLEIQVPYPSREAERRLMIETTGAAEGEAEAALTATELLAAQALVRQMPVGEQVVEAILRVVRSARPGPEATAEVSRLVAWGPSPRAAQALMLGARARALLQGRLSPSLDDVAALLDPVLRHRMALTFAARADGKTVADIISGLKAGLA